MAALVTAVLVPLGCGGGYVDFGGCDPSQCAAGNQCISNGKTTECRLPCPISADGRGGQSACPFDYHCVDGKVPYCARDKMIYAKSGSGLWGASCSPTGGFDANPACDSDQNFWCYGQSPTDGSAFCTQFDCTADDECRGGFYCATINAQPNVVQKARGAVGNVRTACLPRTYCAPCASDVDCVSAAGARAHCVSDNAGSKYCTPECASNGQCNQEASCQPSDEAQANVCVPNAGACVGDGSFCSPCRSDADCTGGGACVSSPYSTEHFCATPSAGGCKFTGTTGSCRLTASCPKNGISGGKTSCTFTAAQNVCSDPQADGLSNDWPNIPNNYCFGEVLLDTNYVPGCWTRPR